MVNWDRLIPVAIQHLRFWKNSSPKLPTCFLIVLYIWAGTKLDSSAGNYSIRWTRVISRIKSLHLGEVIQQSRNSCIRWNLASIMLYWNNTTCKREYRETVHCSLSARHILTSHLWQIGRYCQCYRKRLYCLARNHRSSCQSQTGHVSRSVEGSSCLIHSFSVL